MSLRCSNKRVQLLEYRLYTCVCIHILDFTQIHTKQQRQASATYAPEVPAMRSCAWADASLAF